MPHAEDMRGIGVAAAIGIIGGKPEELNGLADVTPEQQEQMKSFLADTAITAGHTGENRIFDMARHGILRE